MNALSAIKELFPSLKSESLEGADINQVFKVGDFVLKLNKAEEFPAMFEKEAKGLNALRSSNSFIIPEVITHGSIGNFQYLQLEFIQQGHPSENFWEVFGIQLAKLHQQTADDFGWSGSNFIGSLVQENTRHNQWSEFLINQRFQPMIEMAVNAGDVNYVEAKLIEKFYARINEIWPQEKPALLHGDLWAGNYLVNREGKPVLIDPAVYFGHREMDLGMMQLFGGFDSRVYAIYHENFPLEKGWEERVKFNQIYPLLVHVNLFGRNYWDKVASILAPFS